MRVCGGGEGEWVSGVWEGCAEGVRYEKDVNRSCG